jgi:SPX domain protein involved in polyphosphate accumulation
MPYLLADLIVDRVDIVEQGANSAAYISLYKRKEPIMTVEEVIAKLEPDHAAVISAELTRLNGEITTKANELVTKSSEVETLTQELAKSKEHNEPATDEDVVKGLPEAAQQVFMRMRQQKEAAEEAVKKADEAKAKAEIEAKIEKLKALPVEHDKLAEILKGASDTLYDVLTAVAEAVEKSALNETGVPGTGAQTAWDKIEAKAKEIVKNTSITKAKAISQVINENPDLYREYLKGGVN